MCFYHKKRPKFHLLRTVGVRGGGGGGGGGREGLWKRSWKCDIEVPRNRVCAVTKLLFIFYRRAYMQLI